MTMSHFEGKTAVVIGGSSGVGRATVRKLLLAGARVTAVARGAEKLRALQAEGNGTLQTIQGDATDEAFTAQLIRELRPQLLVQAAGATPSMGAVDELDWASFSAPWQADLKASFNLVQQALKLPLAPGSSIVLVSSGAAVQGSPLSGGYAGAKRMQWLLAGYAQKLSVEKQLGIRVLAVLPRQLIVGTTIGARASEAYGRMTGQSAESYMKRWPVPLDVDKVAQAIATALEGGLPSDVNAITVTGTGIEPIS
jgi:NAD(P)-dependent dehydrogenase (short-subunit alcohol dehydrogenase family)